MQQGIPPTGGSEFILSPQDISPQNHSENVETQENALEASLP